MHLYLPKYFNMCLPIIIMLLVIKFDVKTILKNQPVYIYILCTISIRFNAINQGVHLECIFLHLNFKF